MSITRRYDFPLEERHLHHYCHPKEGHVFEHPFLFGDHVAVSNGWINIIIKSYLDCKNDLPQAEARLSELPWSDWEGGKLSDTPATSWGILDERRGSVSVTGDDPFFLSRGLNQWEAQTKQSLIMIGDPSNVIPVPILQLIARLPRAEIYLKKHSKQLLPFRFNGGHGLAICQDLPGTVRPLWQSNTHRGLESMSRVNQR